MIPSVSVQKISDFMKNNWLLNKLNSTDKPCVGFWSVIPSVHWLDVLASTKPDFIIIDGEHGPVSFETALQLAITCEAHSVSPIMRVSGVNESECLKALDIGFHGIQVPNINGFSQVEELIRYSKYAPKGARGFSPFNRASNYSPVNSYNKINHANDNTLINIHIEGKEGIDNIDRFLDIQELDVFFIGLYDISNYLGIPGEIEDVRVMNLLEKLNEKVNKAGKICGSISNSISQLNNLNEIGVRYITHSVDCYVAKNAFENILGEVRESI
jgi:4-hydroxy-2-oxoheptanedioate aldolase